MSTTPATSGSGASSVPSPDPLRWKALLVIGIAQLMVVLDASIVNLALPSAKADLGIADADQQWVVTAYTLAFGGLLLLGGRIADYVGPQARLHHRSARLRRRLGARRHRADRPGCSSPPAGCRARSPRCSPRPRCRSSR